MSISYALPLEEDLAEDTGKSRPATTMLGHRRRTVGFDLWIDQASMRQLPAQDIRHLVGDTHLSLSTIYRSEQATQDGGATDLKPCRKATLRNHTAGLAFLDGSPADLPIRARFLAREEGVHITDAAIAETLIALSDRLHWSKLEKLEEIDNIPAYVPLPES
ncbi:MAG: hypothetical protein M1399_05280 [Actinobacteria bacterium]|nr:hypothetical protein [Actinomycetota bacterium]MCL5446553.1 hypothetical protein [Actinomycetota bacterium]